MANTELQVTEVDFDKIKENIVAFLKSQDTFKDYDFEGSGMSVLSDILSYVAHYQAVYGNFLNNENFLDSAITRNAVLSRAKELNYTPRSYRSPRAKLKVVFTHPGNPNPATIEKGTKFTSTIDGATYVFQTLEAYSVVPVSGTYTAEIDVYEGYLVTQQYTADVNDPTLRFTLSNNNADISHVTVNWKSSSSSMTWTTYARASSVLSLNDTDEIYFIQPNQVGQYEIIFGDGVLGKAVETGNLVSIEYLITQGPAANGCAVFSRAATVAGSTAVTITTIDSAFGGAVPETIESVKLVAPKVYQTQERTVTEDDYAAIILREFPDVDTVSVWGGEKNSPPYYGKVFICINPRKDIVFSNTVKEQIKDELLAKYNILSIRPEIVDPSYLYVNVETHIKYNFRKTGNTAAQIETLVREKIENFFLTELNSFNSTLYFSKLSAAIDELGDYIISNTTFLSLELRLTVPAAADTVSQYTANFANKVQPHTLSSNGFVIDGQTYYLMDWPDHHNVFPLTTGKIRIYRESSGNKIYLNLNAGTIDYQTGEIALSEFGVDSYTGTDTTLNVKIELARGMIDIDIPDSNIYTNGREQLLALNTNMNIEVEGIKLA